MVFLFAVASQITRGKKITPSSFVIGICVSVVLVALFRSIFFPVKNYLEEHNLHSSLLAKLIAFSLVVIISFYLMIAVIMGIAYVLKYVKQPKLASELPTAVA